MAMQNPEGPKNTVRCMAIQTYDKVVNKFTTKMLAPGLT